MTFYVYFSRSGFPVVGGVMVRGWPDNDKVERILAAWDIQKLTDAYSEKIRFLTENPGFKRPLVPKTVQKKIYASQVE